jgi:hypothetical protein
MIRRYLVRGDGTIALYYHDADERERRELIMLYSYPSFVKGLTSYYQDHLRVLFNFEKEEVSLI